MAPFVLNGPITGATFHAYVAQVLAPELKPGEVVVMDNLAAHKRASVQAAVRAAGASFFYLPALQPRPEPHQERVAVPPRQPARQPRVHVLRWGDPTLLGTAALVADHLAGRTPAIPAEPYLPGRLLTGVTHA